MSTDETRHPQDRFAVAPVDVATEELADDVLAARLATDAGKLLLRVRAEVGFAAPATLRDAGDARAHQLLARALARHRPGDAVLSEEGVDDPARLGADRVWIVDPLDGTREFAEPGRRDWAVHVALWQATGTSSVDPVPKDGLVRGTAAARLPSQSPDGVVQGSGKASHGDPASAQLVGGGAPSRVPTGEAAGRPGELVVAAVALPALGTTLSTGGVLPALGRLPRSPRVTASRSRAPAVVGEVAEALGATVVPMGSAGAKVCAVIRGEAEVYVHAGGQYEWDSAAPVALARRAGLHTSRLDGSPLVYNRANPRLPDLVVCHPDLAEAVLAVTRGS